MKALATVVILALASATAGAQQPSVQDTLTWISGRFETVQYEIDAAQVVSTTQMDFRGCQVTVNEFQQSSPAFAGDGTITYGPLELGNLRPESITIDAQPTIHRYIMWLKAANTFPMSEPDMHGNLLAGPSNLMSISFATEDMAKRQAKAWHDAIIACGGKVVPDHLY